MNSITARWRAGDDAPLRDPIIYPGSPELTYPGSWVRLHLSGYRCKIGAELMSAGTPARFTGVGWECRAHAYPEWAEDTP